MVEKAVTVMARARFPLPRNTITLEAIPLGVHATSMIPTAISGGNPNVFAIEYPIRGINV